MLKVVEWKLEKKKTKQKQTCAGQDQAAYQIKRERKKKEASALKRYQCFSATVVCFFLSFCLSFLSPGNVFCAALRGTMASLMENERGPARY